MQGHVQIPSQNISLLYICLNWEETNKNKKNSILSTNQHTANKVQLKTEPVNADGKNKLCSNTDLTDPSSSGISISRKQDWPYIVIKLQSSLKSSCF